jgi:hypothetical protein
MLRPKIKNERIINSGYFKKLKESRFSFQFGIDGYLILILPLGN